MEHYTALFDKEAMHLKEARGLLLLCACWSGKRAAGICDMWFFEIIFVYAYLFRKGRCMQLSFLMLLRKFAFIVLCSGIRLCAMASVGAQPQR